MDDLNIRIFFERKKKRERSKRCINKEYKISELEVMKGERTNTSFHLFL